MIPTMASEISAAELLAGQGDAEDQYQMGLSYKYLETQQDEGKEIEWYKKAAAQGHIEAMTSLGKIYKNSYDYENLSEAMEWYQKAAQLGDIGAYLVIARMYLIGEGVAQDTNKAIDWYQKVFQEEKNKQSDSDYSQYAQNELC